jgi:hypothetical protein
MWRAPSIIWWTAALGYDAFLREHARNGQALGHAPAPRAVRT